MTDTKMIGFRSRFTTNQDHYFPATGKHIKYDDVAIEIAFEGGYRRNYNILLNKEVIDDR